MSLKVLNHYPTVNLTGVFRNQAISIYFDKPIKPTSPTWDKLSVNDSYSFTSIPGTIGPIWSSGINLSGVTSGVIFTPTLMYTPETEYTVYVFGTPNSIIAKDGSELSSTYSFNFIAGTGYYDSTGVAGTPTGEITVTYSAELSGLTYLEEAEVTEFKIYKTYPANQTPNVSGIGVSGHRNIEVFFTGNISTSLSDISGFITIEETPVL